MAAEYYIAKEGLMIVEERQKVRLAIERLGLNSCRSASQAVPRREEVKGKLC